MMQRLVPILLAVALLPACLVERRDLAVGEDAPATEDTAEDDAAGDAATDKDAKSDAKSDAAGTDAEADVPDLGCKQDLDCQGYNDPCHTATCDTATGLCVATPATDGSACVGVTDKCAQSATCQAGACVKVPLVCDDGNPCTVDSCDPAQGCSGPTTAVPKTCGLKKDQPCGCDDGDACTIGDVCQGTTCKGETRTCDDKNACTNDACDAASGCTFTPKPENSVCDDGNKNCTTGDKCVAGVCKGNPVVCPPDANKCNITACVDFLGGCQKAAYLGAPCDDGDPCTDKDACNADDPANGACSGVLNTCDDKNTCTDDACSPGVGCTHTPNTVPVCTLGDVCTAQGSCAAGVCQGPSDPCDDGNVCTDDACDAKAGCTHTANSAPCNDGNACTYSESCYQGACGNGLDLEPDDGNACTTDTCNPASGPLWTVKSNGTGCGVGKSCVGGACQPTSPCGDGICSATETEGTCGGDCPAGGGACPSNDATCIGQCAAKACADAKSVCDADTGCTDIDACVTACASDFACQAGCLLPAAGSLVTQHALNVQQWLNLQWCTRSQCVQNGWIGKACIPASGLYATCAAGCESAMCLPAAAACQALSGCAALVECLKPCAADPGCESACGGEATTLAAAKALVQCSVQRCQ